MHYHRHQQTRDCCKSYQWQQRLLLRYVQCTFHPWLPKSGTCARCRAYCRRCRCQVRAYELDSDKRSRLLCLLGSQGILCLHYSMMYSRERGFPRLLRIYISSVSSLLNFNLYTINYTFFYHPLFCWRLLHLSTSSLGMGP